MLEQPTLKQKFPPLRKFQEPLLTRPVTQDKIIIGKIDKPKLIRRIGFNKPLIVRPNAVQAVTLKRGETGEIKSLIERTPVPKVELGDQTLDKFLGVDEEKTDADGMNNEFKRVLKSLPESIQEGIAGSNKTLTEAIADMKIPDMFHTLTILVQSGNNVSAQAQSMILVILKNMLVNKDIDSMSPSEADILQKGINSVDISKDWKAEGLKKVYSRDDFKKDVIKIMLFSMKGQDIVKNPKFITSYTPTGQENKIRWSSLRTKMSSGHIFDIEELAVYDEALYNATFGTTPSPNTRTKPPKP